MNELVVKNQQGLRKSRSYDHGRRKPAIHGHNHWTRNNSAMNADGTNRQNITQHPGDDRAPTWSPDGEQIAFMSNRNDSFNWEIYVMNADGTNQRNITNNGNANDMYPSWRP